MRRITASTLWFLVMGIIAGIFVSALLVVAGYQARPSYDVQIGGPLDEPHLRDFNVREVTQGDAPTPFRWITGRSQIVFRDIGRQDLQVTLTVSGARPAGVPTSTLRVSVGEHLLLVLLDIAPAPGISDYSFLVPRELLPSGTLTLILETEAFMPEGDPRSLGMALFRARATPGAATGLFIAPSWDVLLSVGLTSAIIGLMLALMGFGAGLVGLGGAAPGVLAGWLLATDRLWLTGGGWPGAWPVAALAAAVIAGLVALLLAWVRRAVPLRVIAWQAGLLIALVCAMFLVRLVWGGWHQVWPVAALSAVVMIGLVTGILAWVWHTLPLRVSATQARLLVAIIFAVCLVRLAGQLHPQIFIVDLFFHRNRFDQVLAGDLLFKIRSAEWGGRETFYLPTAYVLMTPLQWLLNDKLMVIRIFTVAVGTLGALPIFGMATRVWNARAGLIAATLYLTVPIAVLPFSWGITTNLFGEFALLCALAVAVLAYPRLGWRHAAFWLLLLFLLLALLSHPGVVQLTAVSVGLLALLWVVIGRRGEAWKAGAWVALALALAGGLSYLLYYRHFLGDMLSTLADIGRERASEPRPGIGVRVGGSVSDTSLGLVIRYAESRWDWFWGGLRGFWAEAQAYYRVWPVGAAVVGFLGLWLRSRRDTGELVNRKALVWGAVAWGLAALLFALVGWALNLYVRYSVFLLPVVALGAGAFLSWVWARGRTGRVVVVLVLVFFAVEALALWQYRISYALK